MTAAPTGVYARWPLTCGYPERSCTGSGNATTVQPHRVERFKLSRNPRFEEKVRDIVGLYLNPPDRALVLCVDEKSQIQKLYGAGLF